MQDVAMILDLPLRALDQAGSPFLEALGWTSPSAGQATTRPGRAGIPSERPGMAPRPNRPPTARRAKLRDRYGPEKIVILHVDGITKIGEARALAAKIKALGMGWEVHVDPNAPATLTVAPADDIQSLADKFDFAQVKKVDAASRKIWLKVDPATLKP
jgi:hypothetical protein